MAIKKQQGGGRQSNLDPCCFCLKAGSRYSSLTPKSKCYDRRKNHKIIVEAVVPQWHLGVEIAF
jgi:hypothetical protein